MRMYLYVDYVNNFFLRVSLKCCLPPLSPTHPYMIPTRLTRYHLTKVALERKESVMSELEEEREKLIAKVHK